MATNYIGIKLGSTVTCIYKSGNGIVLKEPSLIAMPTNVKNKEVKAIGHDAKRLIGKVSENITIFSPIANGVIQYEELAVLMLKGFLKKIFPIKTLGQNIKAVVTVPLGLSPAEKKQFEIVCFKAGIADVDIVPDIVSFAVGSGLDIKSGVSNLIVNIGGDTTNIGVVCNYSVIQGYGLTIGGNIISVAIAKYIEDAHNFEIGVPAAEQLKTEICSLFENFSASKELVGINKKNQLKEKFVINASELYPIVKNYYEKIAEALRSIIDSCDPAVISDIEKNGICFYGGGTNIIGFEKFMFERTKFKIRVFDIPKLNVLGTGELINNPQLLKRITKNN